MLKSSSSEGSSSAVACFEAFAAIRDRLDEAVYPARKVGPRTAVLAFSDADVADCAAEDDALTLVACSPSAVVAADLRGIPYIVPEDTYDVSVFREVTWDLIAAQRDWLDVLDRVLWQRCPELRETAIPVASQSIFWLKRLFDMYLRVWMEVRAISRVLPVDRIVAYCPEIGTPAIDEGFVPGEEVSTIASRLALGDGWQFVKRLGVSDSTVESDSSCLAVLRRRGRNVRLLGAATTLRHLANLRRRSFDVAYEPSEDILLLVRELHGLGITCRPLLSVAGDESRPKRVWWDGLSLINEPAFFAPFETLGLRRSDLEVNSRVIDWTTRFAPEILSSFDAAQEAVSRFGVSALVLRTPEMPRDFGWVNAMKRSGGKIVTVQHGGFEGNCAYPLYGATDLQWGDLRLAYGTGTATYLSELAAQSGAASAIEATGSPRLDVLRPRRRRVRRIRRQAMAADASNVVAYFATSYQYSWYAGVQSYFGPGYARIVLAALAELSRSRDAYVIYRPFPESPEDPVLRYLESTGLPHVVANRDDPMMDVLAAADLHVIDMPSTILLESLPLERETLLLADSRFIELTEQARRLLTPRVVLCEEPRAFIDSIGPFVNQVAQSDPRDPGFIDTYARGAGAQASAGVMAAAVADLMRSAG